MSRHTKLPPDVRDRILSPQEPLHPARHPGAVEQRAKLVEKIRTARQEIAQLFTDCDAWNRYARKPHEAPIDCDPDGDLAALLKYYDAILKHDTH